MSSFAAAYSIGKMESKAAIQLLRHIPESVKSKLEENVRLLVFMFTYILMK